jgi:hypothetical protein
VYVFVNASLTQIKAFPSMKYVMIANVNFLFLLSVILINI